jgi:hypothetical protein
MIVGYSPIPKHPKPGTATNTATSSWASSVHFDKSVRVYGITTRPTIHSTLHAPPPPPRSLLHTTESLPNLIVQLVKLALDVLLALGVGRLKLHLRQLEDDIGCRVADLPSHRHQHEFRTRTTGESLAHLGVRRVARLDDALGLLVERDKVAEHTCRLVEGAVSVVLGDTVLLEEVVLTGSAGCRV